MAGIVVLEDGSGLYASNMGLGGALDEIGSAITEVDPRLSQWLRDSALRTAPFMDFDVRGLQPESRAAFWLGVSRACEKFSDWDQQNNFSHTVGVIRLFHDKMAVRETTSIKAVPPVDLAELWFDQAKP